MSLIEESKELPTPFMQIAQTPTETEIFLHAKGSDTTSLPFAAVSGVGEVYGKSDTERDHSDMRFCFAIFILYPTIPT